MAIAPNQHALTPDILLTCSVYRCFIAANRTGHDVTLFSRSYTETVSRTFALYKVLLTKSWTSGTRSPHPSGQLGEIVSDR